MKIKGDEKEISTQREKASTPNKKAKSYQKTGKKNLKKNENIKAEIYCRPKSKNNRKLKEIHSKSKTNFIFNALQNEEDQKPFLTIQDSNREKSGNILHKNISDFNNLTEANVGNKNSFKKQYSELGDQNKETGIEDSDIDLKKNKKKISFKKQIHQKETKNKFIL